MVFFILVRVYSLFAFPLGTGRGDGVGFVGGKNLEPRRPHETVDEVPECFSDIPIVSNVAELLSYS